MKLYVAAATEDQVYAARVGEYLKDVGAEITSRWLDRDLERGKARPAEAQAECLEDIDRSDALVLYNPISRLGLGSGGRHFELGYAFARGLPVAVLGVQENVFHWNPDLIVVPMRPIAPPRLQAIARLEDEVVKLMRAAAREVVTKLTCKVIDRRRA